MILDSNLLIDALRGRSQAKKYIEELNEYIISQMTMFEIINGCRNKEELKETLDFLTEFQIIKVSSTITDTALSLFSDFKLSHGIGIIDAFIAATALNADKKLATLNQKHFSMIPELELITPY